VGNGGPVSEPVVPILLGGYPAYLPTSLRRFLADADALAAWVAEDDNGIVGHVALHPRSSDAVNVMEMASKALQLPFDHLGVVARLLVVPHARGGGFGRSLLAVVRTTLSLVASRRFLMWLGICKPRSTSTNRLGGGAPVE
jgi:GNAT superfamily N-acetyltransferase